MPTGRRTRYSQWYHFTQKGAEKTIEALNAGANDFVTKPENLGNNVQESIDSIRQDLLPKIQAFQSKKFGEIKVSKNLNVDFIPTTNLKLTMRPHLVLIGCSTGGPEALSVLFKNIRLKINAPMLIVQHMPPMFTQKLAEMLSKLSPIEVREAKDGDRLHAGVCLIAPAMRYLHK